MLQKFWRLATELYSIKSKNTDSKIRANSKLSNLFFLSLLGCILCCIAYNTTISVALSEPIYTWTDEAGITHYSSDNKSSKFAPVELPKIETENINTKISELKEQAKKTCQNKGGVNCEAGTDVDGSVICSDGSLDSEEVFIKVCKETKLIATIIYSDPKFNNGINKPKLQELIVSVRNESSLKALNVKVKALVPITFVINEKNSGKREVFELEGPNTIEPYGVQEYTFSGKLFEDKYIRRSLTQIECDNCFKPILETKDTKLDAKTEGK